MLLSWGDGCVFFRKACKEGGDSGDVSASVRLSKHSTTFRPCIGVYFVEPCLKLGRLVDRLPSFAGVIQPIAHPFVCYVGARPLLVFLCLLKHGSHLLDCLRGGAESFLEGMHLRGDHFLGGAPHKIVQVLTEFGAFLSCYETRLRSSLGQMRGLWLLSHTGQESLGRRELVLHCLEPFGELFVLGL